MNPPIPGELVTVVHQVGGWLSVLLVAALIGNALARRTLEPVARASEAARLIADGRLDTRLPAGAGDEFGAWAAAFNEMADALKAKIAALTALVAAASVLSEQARHLPDEARRPVELVIADVGRLRVLVGKLMEMRGSSAETSACPVMCGAGPCSA